MRARVALARLVVRRAFARRLWLGLLLEAAALAAITATVTAEVGPDETLDAMDTLAKLAVMVSGLFCMPLTVFFTATTVPDDIAGRQAWMVLAKPPTRGAWLQGQWLGGILLALVVAGASGLLALAAVHAGASRLDTVTVTGVPRTPHAQVAVDAAGEPLTAPDAAVAGMIWLPPGGEWTCDWRDLDREGLLRGGARRVRLLLPAAVRTRDSERVRRARVPIELENPDTGLRILHEPLLQPGRAVEIDMDPDLVGADGRLRLHLLNPSNDLEIGVRPLGAWVIERTGSFALNMFKAHALIGMGAALLASVAVCAGAWLSGPVSLFFTLGVWLLGNMTGFTQRAAGGLVERGFGSHLRTIAGGGAGDQAAGGPTLVDRTAALLLRTVSRVVPDLQRFDPTESLALALPIPWSRIGEGAVYAAIFTAGVLVFGWLGLRRMEMR